MKRLLIVTTMILSLILVACGGDTKPDEAALEGRPMTVVGDGTVATVTTDGLTGRALPPELTDPKSILSRRSVYFDYDQYDIRPEYRDLVAAHAGFLVKNRQYRMLIQGNTDERGSSEYNLALGQKRADAVKRALMLLGVREEQVESVSLGKEKPRNLGHNESAWAENRRSDMLYSGEF